MQFLEKLWKMFSFIVSLKKENICKDIAEDDIGLNKDELGRKIMKEFVRLRAKANSYLKHNND